MQAYSRSNDLILLGKAGEPYYCPGLKTGLLDRVLRAPMRRTPFLDCLCIFFAIYKGFFPWKWSNKTCRQTFYDNCLLQKKITAVNFANHCNLISNWGIMLIKAIRILSFLNPVRTLENCWVFNIMQLTISTQSRLNIPDGILHKGPLSVLPGYTEKDAF